jgi:protein O-GlcNAc transferase
MLSVICQVYKKRVCGCAIFIATILFSSAGTGNARQSPSDALQLKQAARHLQKGDLDNAEQMLEKLLKRKPDLPEAVELLGVIRSKQQRFAEAEALFQRALRLNPLLASAHIYLGRLYKQSNQLELALASFQNAAKILPSNPEVLYNLALLFADNRQFDKAVRTLDAIPEKQRPPDYWELLARLYITANDFANAEQSLRQVLEQKPDSISTLRQLAGVALKLNEPQRAWQYLGQALRLAPNSPDLLYEFAQLSLKNDLGQEAVIATRKALFLEPDRNELLLFLGNALLNTTNFHDAATYLDRYVRLKPDDPLGHLSLGWALYLEKDLDKARIHLEESLRLSPELIDAYYHLGMIAYETGDKVRALDLFSKVVERKSDHASALLGLGMVYLSERQYEKARLALEASARAYGDEPKVHYQLAQVYARLGDEDRARQEQGLYAEAQKKVEERIRLSQRLPFSSSPNDRSKPNQQ